MGEDNTYTATLDRIEEGIAILLLEDDEEVIDELHIRDQDSIPAAGRHEGAVLQVTIEDGEPINIEYDSDAEEQRREKIQDKFDQLSERPPGRDSDS